MSDLVVAKQMRSASVSTRKEVIVVEPEPSSPNRGKLRDYVIETNRTRHRRSARAVAAYINRWAGSDVAEVVPHKTTIRVRGIRLRDLAALLRYLLEPRIGSAIIARATGFTAAVWLLSLRGNRLLTRIA